MSESKLIIETKSFRLYKSTCEGKAEYFTKNAHLDESRIKRWGSCLHPITCGPALDLAKIVDELVSQRDAPESENAYVLKLHLTSRELCLLQMLAEGGCNDDTR
jgi:hypothetical protein